MDTAALINRAKLANVQLVRFIYCDYSGVTRAKALHVSHVANKLHEGLGLTRAQMAINLLEDLIEVEGMEPVGEVRLVPSADTFSVLPWTPGQASIICDLLDQNHLSWGACPRSFLRAMAAEAESMGIKIEATFENEFYLAREENGIYIPFDHSPVYSSIGLDLSAQVMHDIVEALIEQDIVVEQAINEYGPGQQEISIHHAHAIRAADNQIKLRDTVRGVALRHNLLASFAPKPFPEDIGSGCHVQHAVVDPQHHLRAAVESGHAGRPVDLDLVQAGAGAGGRPLRPGELVRAVPQLRRPDRPDSGKGGVAGQDGCLGPGPADALGSVPRFRPLPGDDRSRMAGLAAADLESQRGGFYPPLPGDGKARRPPRGSARWGSRRGFIPP